MAVGAGGKTFDDLLRRLAQVKPLPAARQAVRVCQAKMLLHVFL